MQSIGCARLGRDSYSGEMCRAFAYFHLTLTLFFKGSITLGLSQQACTKICAFIPVQGNLACLC